MNALEAKEKITKILEKILPNIGEVYVGDGNVLIYDVLDAYFDDYNDNYLRDAAIKNVSELTNIISVLSGSVVNIDKNEELQDDFKILDN